MAEPGREPEQQQPVDAEARDPIPRDLTAQPEQEQSKRKTLWWQHGVIYQIYPRSFMDSNGDGIGDLPGIIDRLDHVEWLGADAIWISPIYPSPMADFGYDVSDYADIHPIFGTLQDFDRLVEEAHGRGMRVILDLVTNHTSDEHPWFQESRSSRENEKRDWYIWLDPDDEGGPPNNWLAVFGGGAWEWDEHTQQYYLHSFHVKQPDLNWRNPEVQHAMFDVMRFWLDRGVDGFRVDAMHFIIKDEQFRNNPENPDYEPDEEIDYRSLLPVYSTDQPEVHDVVSMLRGVMDEYDERLLIGEVYVPIRTLVSYYGLEGGAHLPFNFQLLLLPWKAREIQAAIDEYEAALPPSAWPNWVLGNHDKPRVASRVGEEQARVAAMLLLTLRGTPTMYYGDEIGMVDVDIPPGLAHDPQGEYQQKDGRDPERTPMQWDDSAQAGFTTGKPWLPVAQNYPERNVKAQRDTPGSMLTLYHRLLALRRTEPALSVGRFSPLEAVHGDDLLWYLREDDESGRRLFIVLNLGDQQQRCSMQGMTGRVLLTTHLDRESERAADMLDVRPNEGLVIEID